MWNSLEMLRGSIVWTCFYPNIVTMWWHEGAVVSSFASQQEGSEFNRQNSVIPKNN